MEFFIAICGVVLFIVWSNRGYTASATAPTIEILKNRALASENEARDVALARENIRFCFSAMYAAALIEQGYNSSISPRAQAVIIAFDDTVYIYVGNDGQRIAIKEISSCWVRYPEVPYVMNLNVAALFANEMTRQEAKQHVAIAMTSVDADGREKVIRLDHCPSNFIPESFVDFINAQRS